MVELEGLNQNNKLFFSQLGLPASTLPQSVAHYNAFS